MSIRKRKPEKGIEARHSRKCRTHEGGRCNCAPSYRGKVWNAGANKWIPGPFFPTVAQAVNWRQDTQVALRAGTMRAPTEVTFAEEAEALISGIEDRSILNRSGKPYKPSVVRSYRQALRSYAIPEIGHLRLSAIQRRELQDYVDKLRASDLADETVVKKMDPVRVIFRRAVRRDLIAVNPCDYLELPAVRGKRMFDAPAPDRALKLIDALPEAERAFWAVVFFLGTRRGEARALRVRDVDFERRVVRVERGWDDVEGPIEVKTEAGRRAIPLAGIVRRELAAHILRAGRSGDDLVFGRTADKPFVPTTIRSRARKAWKAAGLTPLAPQEARHCAVSYFIAAGMNVKQISVFVGHGDVRQTWNRYGHLLPGDEQRAADQMDGLLHRHGAPAPVSEVRDG